MKKYLGAICSGLASILTFVFLALPAWGLKQVMGSFTFSETFNGYQLISGKAGDIDLTELELGALSRYKIFAIILLVLAVILAIWAIIMLLNSLKVLKLSSGLVSLINNILLIAMVIVSILALTAVLSINGDMAEKLGTTVGKLKEAYDSIGTKVSLWLVTGVNAIACVLVFGCGAKSKKK